MQKEPPGIEPGKRVPDRQAKMILMWFASIASPCRECSARILKSPWFHRPAGVCALLPIGCPSELVFGSQSNAPLFAADSRHAVKPAEACRTR